jgi:uncharacterized pyridoxal phosphate-dependent enzyme
MVEYKSLGIKKMLNASGTKTIFGGSIMRPEVLETMKKAAESFINFDDLLLKSGEYIASLLGVDGALVVNGASAAMVVAISACMAGNNTYKIRNLPVTTKLKNEVIVLKSHRNLFDQAIRQTGAQIVEAGLTDFSFDFDLRSLFTDKTCAVVYYASFSEMTGSLPLEEVVAIARESNVPVIVDAAAELPPKENLWKFYKTGADLVIFSGGKDLRGPQASGLIVGDKDMVELCRFNANPNYGIGRPCKAGKEEVMGLVEAIRLYLQEDFDDRYRVWENQVAYVLSALEKIPKLKARRVFPGEDYLRPSIIPRVYFELPDDSDGTIDDFLNTLKKDDPGVLLASQGRVIIFNPHVLGRGEEKIIADRIIRILNQI